MTRPSTSGRAVLVAVLVVPGLAAGTRQGQLAAGKPGRRSRASGQVPAQAATGGYPARGAAPFPAGVLAPAGACVVDAGSVPAGAGVAPGRACTRAVRSATCWVSSTSASLL